MVDILLRQVLKINDICQIVESYLSYGNSHSMFIKPTINRILTTEKYLIIQIFDDTLHIVDNTNFELKKIIRYPIYIIGLTVIDQDILFVVKNGNKNTVVIYDNNNYKYIAIPSSIMDIFIVDYLDDWLIGLTGITSAVFNVTKGKIVHLVEGWFRFLKLPNNRYLEYGSTMRIYNSNWSCIASLKTVKGDIFARKHNMYACSIGSKILSTDGESICIWNIDGKLLNYCDGNYGSPNQLLPLSDSIVLIKYQDVPYLYDIDNYTEKKLDIQHPFYSDIVSIGNNRIVVIEKGKVFIYNWKTNVKNELFSEGAALFVTKEYLCVSFPGMTHLLCLDQI